jgi:hypothetical protein
MGLNQNWKLMHHWCDATKREETFHTSRGRGYETIFFTFPEKRYYAFDGALFRPYFLSLWTLRHIGTVVTRRMVPTSDEA